MRQEDEYCIQGLFREAFNEYVGYGKRYTVADVFYAMGHQFPNQAPKNIRSVYNCGEKARTSLEMAFMVFAVAPEIRERYEELFYSVDADLDVTDHELQCTIAESADLVADGTQRYVDDNRYCHQDRWHLGRKFLALKSRLAQVGRRLLKRRLPRAA